MGLQHPAQARMGLPERQPDFFRPLVRPGTPTVSAQAGIQLLLLRPGSPLHWWNQTRTGFCQGRRPLRPANSTTPSALPLPLLAGRQSGLKSTSQVVSESWKRVLQAERWAGLLLLNGARSMQQDAGHRLAMQGLWLLRQWRYADCFMAWRKAR
jgi:hypothetical protein